MLPGPSCRSSRSGDALSAERSRSARLSPVFLYAPPAARSILHLRLLRQLGRRRSLNPTKWGS